MDDGSDGSRGGVKTGGSDGDHAGRAEEVAVSRGGGTVWIGRRGRRDGAGGEVAPEDAGEARELGGGEGGSRGGAEASAESPSASESRWSRGLSWRFPLRRGGGGRVTGGGPG